MVGRPGIAPGVSPSQTARISYLPHARFYLVDMQPLFSARQIKMVGVENFAISTSCLQNRPSTFDITLR